METKKYILRLLEQKLEACRNQSETVRPAWGYSQEGQPLWKLFGSSPLTHSFPSNSTPDGCPTVTPTGMHQNTHEFLLLKLS